MGTATGLRRRQKPTTKLETVRLVESQRALLCREGQLLLRFSSEGSRQLKLNRASLAKQGAESAGRRFSITCSSTCRSACRLRDLKSPARISVQGLFRAVFHG